jgi:transposase
MTCPARWRRTGPRFGGSPAVTRRWTRRSLNWTRKSAPWSGRPPPALLELFGVGPETAGQLLASAGDNPERMRSEGAFAHLAGVAPIPASSGRTHRHRLNRGGDRAANNALHTIVLTRMRFDERTRAYVERRTKEGLNKKDIMRCLKRFVAREVYRALTSTPTEQITQTDLTPAA